MALRTERGKKRKRGCRRERKIGREGVRGGTRIGRSRGGWISVSVSGNH